MPRHYPFTKQEFIFGDNYDVNLFNPQQQYREQEQEYEQDLELLNELVRPIPWLHNWTLEELVSYKIPYIARSTADNIKNYAGAVYARELYFDNFSPGAQGFPSQTFTEALNTTYGSYENFRRVFQDYAEGAYGQGWVWIATDHDGNISIEVTKNNEIPSLDTHVPLVAFNTWEYEDFLKYKKDFNLYLNSWFDAINWSKVNARLDNAIA